MPSSSSTRSCWPSSDCSWRIRTRPATPLAAGTTFTRGLVWLALAIVAFAVVAAFDYRWLKTFAWPLYFANIGLLLASLFLGDGVGGVARWVTVFGLQFQFSEIAKILMIVVLANWIASRAPQRMSGPWTIVGAGLLVAPAMILVLMQPDLGTSLVFLAILAGTLFLAGASIRWLGTFAIIGMAAMPFVWNYILRDYQKQRLTSFLDPAADPLGSGYQLVQSRIAVGSGGLFGKGITNGTQNQLDFLPVQTTDFVYAILAEELGFIGGILVLGLFVLLLLAGPPRRLARRGPVRARVLGRHGLDDPVPGPRQRRHGHRHHAHHRDPAAVRDPWWRVAHQHRHRTRRAPEHQPQTGTPDLVTSGARPARRMTQPAVVPCTSSVNRTMPKTMP